MNTSLVAAKVALAPVLLVQGQWLRRTALRLPEPEGSRMGTVGEGRPRLRVLVVGDSSAAGVGVADQAQALALPLASRLSEQLCGAVSWQLVARTGVNTEQARVLLGESQLNAADVAVVALGVNDVSSQTSPARYVEQMEMLWQDVCARTGARWAVFSGLPPMHLMSALPHPLRWYLGRYARDLDAALRRWTEAQSLGYCALDWASDASALASDGFHPGPQLYPQWARRLAELVSARQQS